MDYTRVHSHLDFGRGRDEPEQYVFIRLVSTGVALGLQLVHLYAEGDFDPKSGYLWITVVTCLSQSWALYVLVLFYR